MSPSNWFRDFMAAAGADFAAGRRPHNAPIGPPMDLANMRKNGVHSIAVFCLANGCVHKAEINVDTYPAYLPVKSFEHRMVCTACGSRRVEVRPAWK